MIRNKDSKAIADDLAPNSVHAVITDRRGHRSQKYTYEEAKECVKLLGILMRREYYFNRYKEDPRLPSNPNQYQRI